MISSVIFVYFLNDFSDLYVFGFLLIVTILAFEPGLFRAIYPNIFKKLIKKSIFRNKKIKKFVKYQNTKK